MVEIRKFEETLLDLFSQGKLAGTTHTYIGQEAIAVSAMSYMKDEDAVFTNHRCHGHFIAYGGNRKELLAEIMGKKEGVCLGRGGSQHLCYKNFYSNGIQGGMLPVAAGYALGYKLRMSDGIAVSFIGDGTMGEGIVYETLNMASLWDIPLLVIVEDNGYAQSTSKHMNLSGTICERIEAFHIECRQICSNDIEELNVFFESVFSAIRRDRKPIVCIVETYRLAAHSKGDDYRDKQEIESWKAKDPLLLAESYYNENIRQKIQKQAEDEMIQIIRELENSVSEKIQEIGLGISYLQNIEEIREKGREKKRFYEEINDALHHIFENDLNAVILGEDIADPYGGAFKITKGLSEKHKTRVFSTPISEAGFAGIANGLALNGFKPIVEIMFGDFSTLILDQILNHAAKFSWMYAGKKDVPVLIRIPSGGRRGYGPTHSQSLEHIFMGYPNISVIAPTIYHDVKAILQNAYNEMSSPVVFVEYKSFYAQYMKGNTDDNFIVESDGKKFDTLNFFIEKEQVDVAVICYGEMLMEAKQAAWELMIEHEINVQIVCPCYIYPFPVEEIYKSISQKTEKIFVIENAFEDLGWAQGIAYHIMRRDMVESISRTVQVIAPIQSYIPSSIELEKEVLVSSKKIKEAVINL